jgi:hypothetical protein
MAFKRITFSLEEEYVELLREVVSLTRRSQTDEFRLMLDARAVSLGLEPIHTVDPKFSALLLEGLQRI